MKSPFDILRDVDQPMSRSIVVAGDFQLGRHRARPLEAAPEEINRREKRRTLERTTPVEDPLESKRA